MASTIITKNGTGSASPSSLQQGELAINVDSGKIFYGAKGGTAVSSSFTFDELVVEGNLTAQQYIVSSSVTYTTQSFSSGSTIFGDTQDDTHLFTGSVDITGSVTAISFTGDGSGLTNVSATPPAGTVSSSAQIASDISGAFDATSASLAADIPTNNNELTNGAGYTTNTGTVDTTGTPANNQVAVFTDADTIEGSNKLKFNTSVLEINSTNSDSAGIKVYGGAIFAATPYITPYGNHTTMNFGDGDTGHVFDFRRNKISFDSDSTNTYIQADADDPENLEIHADGNIELRADNNLEIYSPISTNITASGNISSSGTITANEYVGLPSGILSSSAQIASDISGSFVADSASFSTRVTANETITAKTLISSSTQILEDAGANQILASNPDATAITASGILFRASDSSIGIGVANISDIDARLHIVGTGTANNREVLFKVNNSDDHDRIQFIDEGDNLPSGLKIDLPTFGMGLYANNGPIRLFSGGTGSADTKLRADSDGIEVTGSIEASGDVTANGTITANTIEVDTDIDITTNNEFLRGKLTGGATRNIIGIDDSDNITVGNSTADSIKLIGDVSGSGTVQLKPRLDLPKTSTTDGDYYGTVVYFGTNTSGMTAGTIYYYRNTGAWVSTQADSTTTSLGLLGVALGTAASDGVLIQGTVTLNHDPGALGDTLYLSDTNAGRATSTIPSSTNDVVRVIGYCLDATNGQVYFNPSSDHIVHA